eukprot:CAMPEP_0119430218 /NCGR_PEP_ID=MMETSP1335-20130426/43679_1 /TAXON_ID=259385 /ORGANISM="Chrysoculter rhomboideus, Strain RCC1486" /LENGTH=33 /DNA_ID= /DNA_START= /DNA_END= /DNA_ORIENTATION=
MVYAHVERQLSNLAVALRVHAFELERACDLVSE